MVGMWTLLACVLPLCHAARPIGDLRSGRRVGLSGISNILINQYGSNSTNGTNSPYPAYTLDVPVDHFHSEDTYAPHTNQTFKLRYFFEGKYYKAGGPVIILAGGETDVSDRFPYLQKGILAQLAQATNGIAVLLEHRYYGASIPTPDFSTKNLRFLTTQQALADTAYFAEHVKFKGLEDKKLNAPDVPYIAYGGSYAGAFVAFLRTQYSELFFGAISSSGVTKAIYDYWQYYEDVRLFAPEDCISNTQNLTNVVDKILLHKINSTNGTYLVQELKAAFGLLEIEHDDDFANILAQGIGTFQNRNWDPAVNDPSFSYYCGNLTANSTVYPGINALQDAVQRLLRAAGYSSQVDALTTPFLNWIGYINETIFDAPRAANQSLNSYYTSYNSTFYQLDSLDDGDWRSWPYQYCTQWGFLQTGSGVPTTQLPLISRTITLEYESIICREAFNITTPPDVDAINQFGGFDISADRLAIIDGQADPWRYATPHSPLATGTRDRKTDLPDHPFILIPGAVHHWDENGIYPGEETPSLPPQDIKTVQAQEVAFVTAWLKEWQGPSHGSGTGVTLQVPSTSS